MKQIYICRVCLTLDVEIETWIGSNNLERWRCKNCNHSGLMIQPWHPILVNENIADKYAIEFQTDPDFLPPE